MIDLKLKEFLDELDKGAYVVNRNRVILYWNKAAERITGYSADEVVGKSCKDNILCHIDRSGVLICTSELCPLYRTMITGESTRVPFAVYAKTKKGPRIPMSVNTYPISINGEIIGGLEIFDEGRKEEIDLKVAMGVQMALIPNELPENIELLFRPSSFIGGDLPYYRYPWLGIIDVSGHGVSAALVASSMKVVLDDVFSSNPYPGDVSKLLDERFRELGDIDLYFTGIFVRFCEKREVELLSLGHVEPIAIKGGKAEILKLPKNFPVGFGLNKEPEFLRVSFGEGDKLLVFSDGLTEVKTEDGILGHRGVMEILEKTTELKEIYRMAMEMNKRVLQEDDVTIFEISF